jgi:hypothetical protein
MTDVREVSLTPAQSLSDALISQLIERLTAMGVPAQELSESLAWQGALLMAARHGRADASRILRGLADSLDSLDKAGSA